MKALQETIKEKNPHELSAQQQLLLQSLEKQGKIVQGLFQKAVAEYLTTLSPDLPQSFKELEVKVMASIDRTELECLESLVEECKAAGVPGESIWLCLLF